MTAGITHILDANAVIAYFGGEEGHEIVAGLLADGENVLAIHAVQLCEVYYGYYRADGQLQADEAWRKALEMARFLPDISENFVKRVGRWKARQWQRNNEVYVLSIADAFAAATAEEYACPLVTKDRNDFGAVEAAGALQFMWLR